MPQQPNLEKIMESLSEMKDLLAEMNKYRFAEQYLDNDEFTHLFSISKKTAQLWRESGMIPFARLGKKFYYRLSDIDALFTEEFKRPKHLKKKKLPAQRRRVKKNSRSNGWTIRV